LTKFADEYEDPSGWLIGIMEKQSIRFSGHGELAPGDVKMYLGMTVRIGKKESPKKVTSKIQKVTSRSKKINWDKYVGKIKFPVDALTYQRKVRDEWAG
jgi:hypothetical protein